MNKTECRTTGRKGEGEEKEGRKQQQQQQQNYCNKQRVSDKKLLCQAEETARKREICHNKHNNKTQMQTKLRKKRAEKKNKEMQKTSQKECIKNAMAQKA